MWPRPNEIKAITGCRNVFAFSPIPPPIGLTSPKLPDLKRSNPRLDRGYCLTVAQFLKPFFRRSRFYKLRSSNNNSDCILWDTFCQGQILLGQGKNFTRLRTSVNFPITAAAAANTRTHQMRTAAAPLAAPSKLRLEVEAHPFAGLQTGLHSSRGTSSIPARAIRNRPR